MLTASPKNGTGAAAERVSNLNNILLNFVAKNLMIWLYSFVDQNEKAAIAAYLTGK